MQISKGIRYSGLHDLSLDLYRPDDSAASATILFLHGGGFTRGSHRNVAAVSFAKKLTAAGFALASVQYRLKTSLDAFSDADAALIDRLMRRSEYAGIGLNRRLYGPACIAALEDASEAIEFLWVNGARYGIQTRKVGVLGISAGGILGLSLAYRPNLIDARLAQPEAVVAITGAFVHPWRLNGNGPPVLMFHGEKDTVIPIERVGAFVERSRQRGLPIRLIRTGVAGHAAQLTTVLQGQDADGEPFMQQIIDHFRAALTTKADRQA